MERVLFKATLIFVITFVGLHAIIRMLATNLQVIIPAFWPINVFELKIPVWQDVVTLGLIGLLWLVLMKYWNSRTGVYELIVMGLVLILMTNLLQGYSDGYIRPQTGKNKFSASYWNDTKKIYDGQHFLKNYTIFQPNLLDHSRVHPPGAVLFYYGARQIWDDPLFITLLILMIGLIGAVFLYRLIRIDYPEKLAKQSVWLYLLIPAIQIYYLSSLDAVIVSLFILTAYGWRRLIDGQSNKTIMLLATVFCLWMTTFITFAGLLLIPVMLLSEWLVKHEVKQSLKVIGLTVLIYVIINQLAGFNYLESLTVARRFESLGGSQEATQWIVYTFTRIQGVAEIIFFLGAFITYAIYDGVRKAIRKLNMKKGSIESIYKEFRKQPPTWIFSLMVIFGLVGFLLMGAYYTGETARAAMYVYPFLMVLSIATLKQMRPNLKQMKLLSTVLLAQSVLMQLLGFYVW